MTSVFLRTLAAIAGIMADNVVLLLIAALGGLLLQYQPLQKPQDKQFDIHDPEHALRTVAGGGTIKVRAVGIIDGLLDCKRI